MKKCHSSKTGLDKIPEGVDALGKCSWCKAGCCSVVDTLAGMMLLKGYMTPVGAGTMEVQPFFLCPF